RSGPDDPRSGGHLDAAQPARGRLARSAARERAAPPPRLPPAPRPPDGPRARLRRHVPPAREGARAAGRLPRPRSPRRARRANDPLPLEHLAVVEEKLGRFLEARTHFERALELGPYDARGIEKELARALAQCGAHRAHEGDTRGARADLERSLALDPAQEKAAE